MFDVNLRSGMEARPYTVKINLYKTVGNEIMADGHVFYALYVYLFVLKSERNCDKINFIYYVIYFIYFHVRMC